MYEVEQLNVGSLMRCFHGYYSELLVQNNTRENIVAIDNHNNKTVIPPTSTNQFGREQIIIWSRKTVNPTIDSGNNQKQVPGIRITIPKHDLAHEGGFYIKEIDLVLCTEAMSVAAAHPYSSISYADAAEQAIDTLVKSCKDAPTIKIMANDPEGRYNKLYTVFGDVIIDIDVTKVYGEAELRVSCIIGSRHDDYTVDLNEFLDSANDYLELSELPMSFITTNRARAQQYASEFKKIPQSEVDELLKKAATKSAKDIAAVKAQYENDLETKISENKRLSEEIKTITAAKEDSDRKYKELQAAIDASNTMREHDVKGKELSLKEHESNNKRDISDNDLRASEAKRDSAETENKYKLAHLVIAAAVPTVAALSLKAIEMYAKSQASKSALTISKDFINFI